VPLDLLGCNSQQWFGWTTYTGSHQFHTHVVDKAPEVLPLWFEPNSTSAHSMHFVSSWFHTGAEESATHCGTMFRSHVLTRQKQTSQLFLTSYCSNTIAAICDDLATHHYGAGQSNTQRHACQQMWPCHFSMQRTSGAHPHTWKHRCTCMCEAAQLRARKPRYAGKV
jgi:hypothetical protein